MSGIQLLGAPQSVYVRAVRMALQEKNAWYALLPLPPHAQQISAINPFGKIPVMRHGAIELYESIAIMFYVDRHFPGPDLLPRDTVPAARTLQWASALNCSVFPALQPYMQANAFPKGRDGKPDRRTIDEQFPQVQRQIAILNAAVEDTGHLVGDGVTIADILLVPMLAYLRIFPESAAALRNAPALTGYFDRHAQRSSFAATMPPPLN